MAPAIQAERQAPAPSVDPNNIPPSPEPDPTLPNAVPAIPGVNPVQQAQPAVDLKTGKLPALGDVEQKTAEEYSKRIDPARSYKVDIAREDGVVLRGAGYFHKTAGDDATGGAFSEGQNGVRYHNTGTTEDGRVLARHSVAPNGEVRMRHTKLVLASFHLKSQKL